jgi:hypothetical protein
MISTEILLTTAVVTSTVTVLMIGFMLFLRSSRESKYNEKRSQAELSYLRKELEHSLAEINARLTATQDHFADVNHLLMISQKFERNLETVPQKSYLSDFLRSAGLSPEDLNIDQSLIFVLTPFHPDEDDTFNAIRDACRSIGLNCIRGDETRALGSILTELLKYIVKSRLIIANVNGRNPNVYYELGIAHALDKPVLITARAAEDVPFNLQNERIYFILIRASYTTD